MAVVKSKNYKCKIDYGKLDFNERDYFNFIILIMGFMSQQHTTYL